MENKQYAKEPLLYINQPNIGKPTVVMQHDYYTPEKEDKFLKDESGKYENHYDEHPTEFKDMTISEKISYLVRQPEYIPKIQCSIHTKEKLYRGIIADFENDVVYFKEGRRRVTIPYEKIEDIKLVSL